MRTPAGKECKFYFGDFHRGRNVQACRLIERNPDSSPWEPKICQSCPVPDILQVNQSKNLKLDGKVVKKLFGFVKEIEIEGWCSECFRQVSNLKRGCANCTAQQGPSIFDLEESPR